MKKITVTFLAVALVALGAIFVIGQTKEGPVEGKPGFRMHGERGHFGGRHGGRKMLGHLFRQLDLTDAQKEQMKAIGQKSRESMKPIMEQMRANREALQNLSDGTFDEAQVQAIAAQQGTLTAQLIVEKERTKAAMFNVLTAEQKAKAAELKAQHKQRMADRKAKFAERKAAAKENQ